MNKEEKLLLFKCLADKSRLTILEYLSGQESYVEKISQMLGLAASTVSFHLKKMEEVGLVSSKKDQYYTIYFLNKDKLDIKLIEILKNEEQAAINLKEQKYREDVIKAFFKDGKLPFIPVQRKKRRIILEEILKSFDPIKRYTEKEVNIIIADFNDDFCFIRRELINEKLMKRENSIYWVNKE